MPDVNRVLAQMKKFTEVFCLLADCHVYIWLWMDVKLVACIPNSIRVHSNLFWDLAIRRT